VGPSGSALACGRAATPADRWVPRGVKLFQIKFKSHSI
jgi:hypothetical protein